MTDHSVRVSRVRRNLLHGPCQVSDNGHTSPSTRLSHSPSTHLSGSIPGSRTERSLHKSFSRMLSELLRFSSSARLLAQIPEELQAAHRPRDAPATVAVPIAPPLVEADAAEGEGEEEAGEAETELDDSVLAQLGL